MTALVDDVCLEDLDNVGSSDQLMEKINIGIESVIDEDKIIEIQEQSESLTTNEENGTFGSVEVETQQLQEDMKEFIVTAQVEYDESIPIKDEEENIVNNINNDMSSSVIEAEEESSDIIIGRQYLTGEDNIDIDESTSQSAATPSVIESKSTAIIVGSNDNDAVEEVQSPPAPAPTQEFSDNIVACSAEVAEGSEEEDSQVRGMAEDTTTENNVTDDGQADRVKKEENQKQEEVDRLKLEAERQLREEAAVAAALEKYDSFDVIGDLVDKDNQELARMKRERDAASVYLVTSPSPTPTSSTFPLDNSLMPGKERSELGKELWEAAGQGKVGPCRMLLQAGADPNFTVRTGLMSTSSPLVTASCKGHAAVVDCLLEHHTTSVNMSVSGGWTALMWAAWYGHTEVVQTLLTAPGVQKDKLNHAGD